MHAPSSDTIEIVRQALTVPPEPLNALFRSSIRAEAPLRQLSWVRGLAHRSGAPVGLTQPGTHGASPSSGLATGFSTASANDSPSSSSAGPRRREAVD